MYNSQAKLKTVLKQWGVGHGGFHTAKILDQNGDVTLRYVYDCGSRAHVTRLEPAIDEYMEELVAEGTEVIDVLYLSHFDQDHVNGLKYLADSLDNASPRVRIDKIVVPFLTPVQQLAALASSAGVSPIFTNLVLSPVETLTDLFPDAEVEVLPPDGDSDFGEVTSDEVPDDGSLTPSSPGSKSYPTGPGSPVLWEVVAYVQPAVTQQATVFWREVKKKGLTKSQQLDKSTIQNLIVHHATDLRQLAIRFLKPNDGSNRSSIILYSGPEPGLDAKNFVQKDDTYIHWTQLPSTAKLWWNADPTNFGGWLSTGDARLETPQSVTALAFGLGAKRIARVMVISAPHHGSKNNSDTDLWTRFFNARFVTIHAKKPTSAKSHHPHKNVTNEIRKQGGFYHIVSDSTDNITMSCTIS